MYNCSFDVTWHIISNWGTYQISMSRWICAKSIVWQQIFWALFAWKSSLGPQYTHENDSKLRSACWLVFLQTEGVRVRFVAGCECAWPERFRPKWSVCAGQQKPETDHQSSWNALQKTDEQNFTSLGQENYHKGMFKLNYAWMIQVTKWKK
jgi:hypothetical protein